MLPRFRPDQYLSLAIIIITVLFLPTRIVAAQPPKPIVQLKPFPELNQNLLLALPPSSQFNPNALTITARSALAIDLKNPSILYEKAATKQYPQASLTKLMTALVVRDLYQPDQIIEIKLEDL